MLRACPRTRVFGVKPTLSVRRSTMRSRAQSRRYPNPCPGFLGRQSNLSLAVAALRALTKPKRCGQAVLRLKAKARRAQVAQPRWPRHKMDQQRSRNRTWGQVHSPGDQRRTRPLRLLPQRWSLQRRWARCLCHQQTRHKLLCYSVFLQMQQRLRCVLWRKEGRNTECELRARRYVPPRVVASGWFDHRVRGCPSTCVRLGPDGRDERCVLCRVEPWLRGLNEWDVSVPRLAVESVAMPDLVAGMRGMFPFLHLAFESLATPRCCGQRLYGV